MSGRITPAIGIQLTPCCKKPYSDCTCLQERPLSVVVRNIFCPTGQGGGIDPTCGVGKGGSGSPAASSGGVSSTPVKVTKDSYDEFRAEFTTPAGRYEVVAMKRDQTRKGEEWRLDFYRMTEGAVGVTAATGTAGAGAVEVFRKVGQVVDQFISDRQPYKILFTAAAEEGSRVSLYDRVAKTLAKKHDYEAQEPLRTEAQSVYQLTKNEQLIIVLVKRSVDTLITNKMRQVVRNIFCPTGPGGGVKPDCPVNSSAPEVPANISSIIDSVLKQIGGTRGKDEAYCVPATSLLWDKLGRPADFTPHSFNIKGNKDEEGNHVALYNPKTNTVIDPTGAGNGFADVTTGAKEAGYGNPQKLSTAEIRAGSTKAKVMEERLAKSKKYNNIVKNVFCKTGQGGGRDPTCGAGKGGNPPISTPKMTTAAQMLEYLANTNVPSELIPQYIYVGMPKHAADVVQEKGLQTEIKGRLAGISKNRADSIYVATQQSRAEGYGKSYVEGSTVKIDTSKLDKKKFYYDPLDIGDHDMMTNPRQMAYRGPIPPDAVVSVINH